MEEWNDSILGPDGTGAPVYQPMITIRSGDRMLIHKPLNAGLNSYSVPMAEWYLITAADCHGQVIYEM